MAENKSNGGARWSRSWNQRLGAVLLLAGLSLTGRAAVTCTPAPSGLVAWWPGDGNANDIASLNNGTLMGGATANASGKVGSAFSFDGTNGYAQIPDSAALDPAVFTIETWVCFRSLDSAGNANAGHQYLVFKRNTSSTEWDAFSLGKDRYPNVPSQNGDILYFLVAPAQGAFAEIDSTTIVTPNVWYHIAGVRGPNYIQLYINGRLEGQVTANFPQDYAPAHPLFLGSTGEAGWDGKLNGWLDEVSLYNRALSASEIAAIYQAGAAGKCKPAGVPPTIVNQPQSAINLAGTPAAFGLAASGSSPMSYQWWFNSSKLTANATTNLVIPDVQPTNAGLYGVVISNPAGSVTSSIVSLTVIAPPALQNPRANPDGSFSLTLSGTPGWAYAVDVTTDLVNWTLLTNLSTATGQVSFTDPTAANNPRQFYRARTTY